MFSGINGNPIPAQLPPELIPPSSRDLGHSVDFLKDLLRNDTNARNTQDFPEASAVGNQSYARQKSLHSTVTPPSRKDATTYKHDDSGPTYKSSSRHLDRKTVRASGEDPDDLDEIKRQLDSSQQLLDKSKNRDAEDDALAQEKDDLLYEIKRVQSDIEHNSRGRRTEAKETERRRLDRELDRLKFEKLPELERKLDARAQEVAAQRRRDNRDRDTRNDRYGRYEDRSKYDRDYDRPSSRDDRRRGDSDEEEERGYMRGTFDRPSSRGDYRSRDEDRNGRRSPDRSERSAPPPPPAPTSKPAAPPPPPAAAAPAKPSASSMTAEQRKEFIRAEAARRVQERLRALGIASDADSAPVTPPSAPSTPQPQISSSSATADQEAEDRAKQRQLKLEKEKMKDLSQQEVINQQTEKALQQVSAEVTASEMAAPKSQGDVVAGARAELDRDEDELRAKEAALAKAKADQKERIRKMEEELEESKRLEEEFKRKKEMFAAGPQKTKGPPPPVPKSRQAVRPNPPSAPSISSSAPVAPPAPPAPPAPRSPAVQIAPPAASPQPKPSTNPFHRPNLSAAPASQSPAAEAPFGKTNPFGMRNRDQAATPPESKPSTPKPAFIPPPPRPTEDWDMPTEHFTDSDSSDDEEPSLGARNARQQLAGQLFGGIMPSRPTSAAGSPASPAPPSVPPAAPRAPVISVPSGPVDRGSLLSQIQGGIGLKKAKTNDRSNSAMAGAVIGNNDMPPQQTRTEEPSSYQQSEPISSPQNANHRQSVDWYNGLASESIRGSAPTSLPAPDESMEEEGEEEADTSQGGFLSNVMHGVQAAASSAAAAVGLTSEAPGVNYSSCELSLIQSLNR